jgi:nucleoside-diphosphate-sugar epimerase
MDRYKVCVLGGSGFLGAEICRLIVAMGHRATSVSRSGRPAVDQPWVEGVEWVQAEILDETGAPSQWSHHLEGCEAVIHAVGIVAEQESQRQTFARLHRDSVAVAASRAGRMGVAKFVFISAGKLPPGVPHAYLQAKLDAESILQQSELPVAILRPTYIYSGNPGLFGALARPLDRREAGRTNAGESSGGHPATPPPIPLESGAARPSAQAATRPPDPLLDWTRHTRGLRLEKVAMAALRAALQPETVGILEVPAIDHLGDAMFIQ